MNNIYIGNLKESLQKLEQAELHADTLIRRMRQVCETIRRICDDMDADEKARDDYMGARELEKLKHEQPVNFGLHKED
jgi:hypothetical protein